MTALSFVFPRPYGRRFRMDVGRFLRLAFVMGPKGLLATAGVLTNPSTVDQCLSFVGGRSDVSAHIRDGGQGAAHLGRLRALPVGSLQHAVSLFFFFFFISLGLELSDTKVYKP